MKKHEDCPEEGALPGEGSTSMSVSQLLFFYIISTLALFTLGVAAIGVKATFLGFSVMYSVCALAVLALWWWEERQWSGEDTERSLLVDRVAPSASSVRIEAHSEKVEDLLTSRQTLIAEADSHTLEARAVALTDRISEVYPFVAREDIHKIVWMAMVEICHERMQSMASEPALSVETRQIV